MRFVLPIIAAATLAACSPDVPNSAAGVGFGDYDDYQRQREAELAGAAAQPVTVQPPVATTQTAATQPADNTPVVPTQPAQVVVNTSNPSISDEQDFGAVASRESIESDAARLAAQREQYQVVQPTAVPTRSGSGGPNIVEFALATTNLPGQAIYSRNRLRLSDYNRNCVRYTSGDKAQEAFLKAGGPEKDKLNLDPDGDGFACEWDPTPFRNALNR
ncbi:hypothetical protein ATO10_14279 [Actibacterium atlanticum]|uniref:Excalibur calcium-binding domain-containing protein n=1 Tax=Actibacterium atlanticum TaxID=1461693 RepID=A0A058ZJI4_9RHOB|nr:hypothetical protein [Actibacterium atlanticum]KCV80976.1 hypothetical protein ATO10_14279 [Actibacterium atlanticum]